LKNLKESIGRLSSKGSFTRNVAIMSSGAMINVVLSIGLTPIVTRLYSKEEWGIFTLFSSTVTTLSVLSTLLLPSGFVIPKFRMEFLSLLKICIVWLLSFISVLFILIILFKNFTLSILKVSDLGNVIYLVPLAVFLSGISNILVNWNVRAKLFAANATSNVASGVTIKAVQIVSKAIFDFSYLGLIFSNFFASFVQWIILFQRKSNKYLRYLPKISWSAMRSTLVKYRKYPIYLMPGNFINTFGRGLPVFFFTPVYGLEVTGAFGLAVSIIGIPYRVLGNSISPVFLQRANELYHSDSKKLEDFTRVFHGKMLLLGSIIFGIAFAFSDILFPIYLGKKWLLAGQMAQVLSVYLVVMLVTSPLQRIYRVVRKEQLSFYMHVVVLILRLVALFVGVKYTNPLVAVGLFAIANLIGYLIHLLIVYKILGLNSIKVLFKTLFMVAFVFSVIYAFRMILLSLI